MIEFRCPSCSTLLRVPSEHAGGQAKCPKCGTVTTVPAGQAAMPPSESPFAGGPATGGDPSNPYRSPAEYGEMRSAATMGIVPTRIDLGDVFSRAWQIFTQRIGLCIGVWFVVFGLGIFVNIVVGVGVNVLGGRDPAVRAMLDGIGNIITGVFSTWIGTGQAIVFLGIARGRDVSLGELFNGGPFLLRAIGASILFILAVFGGTILLIIPGIIFYFMFSQFLYLIVDRNVGVIDSLKLSSQITSGNKLTLFAIGLVLFGLGILAILPCFLGLIVLVPFSMLLHAVMYLSMSGQPTAEQAPQSFVPVDGPAASTAAPIEFRCNRCGCLLRTPADSRGRNAQCPECGNVQPVPETGPSAPPPGSAGTSPFGGPQVG